MASGDFIKILREVRGTGAPEVAPTDGIFWELTIAATGNNNAAGKYGHILEMYNNLNGPTGSYTDFVAKYNDFLVKYQDVLAQVGIATQAAIDAVTAQGLAEDAKALAESAATNATTASTNVNTRLDTQQVNGQTVEANLNAVASDSINIGKVAAVAGDVATVASIDHEVNVVALKSTEVTAVSDSIEQVANVSDSISDVGVVATHMVAVNKVSIDIDNVNILASEPAHAALLSGEANAFKSEREAWESEAHRRTSHSYAYEPLNVFVKLWSSIGDGTFTYIEAPVYSSYHYSQISLSGGLTVIGYFDASTAISLPIDSEIPNVRYIVNVAGNVNGTITPQLEAGDELRWDHDNTVWDIYRASLQYSRLLNVPENVNNAVSRSGDTMTGDLTTTNIITAGLVDGRDVSVDGAKLDTTEARVTAAEGDAVAIHSELATTEARVTSVEGDAVVIHSELDTTQTGAGLNIDGTYSSNTGTNSIDTATSLNDADVKLDTAIKAGDDILHSELDTTQTGAGLNADGTYATLTGTNYIDGTSTLAEANTVIDAMVGTIRNDLTAETTRATTAETTLQTTVGTIRSDLTTETTRATTAETTLQTNIDTEASTRAASDGVLATLTTIDKSSLVGAINELDADKYNKTGGTITGDVSVTGNETVTGTLGVGGHATIQSATIQGDLTVKGTTTTVDSTVVAVADNQMLLNAGETGAGITKGSAGLRLDRGTLNDYVFGFSEYDQTFTLGEIEAWPITKIVGDGTNAVVTITGTNTRAVGDYIFLDQSEGFDGMHPLTAVTATTMTFASTTVLTVSPKAGEVQYAGNLQRVLTREDSPLAGGVMIWDDVAFQAKATKNLTLDTLMTTGTANVGGNILVTGTVDGRDVYADGSKLDGIEPGATADQLASEVPVTPTGNLAATDVQAGLVELQGDVDTLNTGSGVTNGRVTELESVTGSGTSKRYDKRNASLDIQSFTKTAQGLMEVIYVGDDNATVYYRDVMTRDANGALIGVKHYHGTADLVTASGTTTMPRSAAGDIISVTYADV